MRSKAWGSSKALEGLACALLVAVMATSAQAQGDRGERRAGEGIGQGHRGTFMAQERDRRDDDRDRRDERSEHPPRVQVTLGSPAAGAVFTAPAAISLSATASVTPEHWKVLRVDFYANGALVGTSAGAPYTFTWASVPAGAYTLTAKAYATNPGQARAEDREHANRERDERERHRPVWEGTSAPVSIVVNAPPSVGLTAPIAGALYNAPATIGVAANSADSDGTVAKVEFYAGATLIGTATAAPYSIQWTNVAAGGYVLTARATDNRGAATTSQAISIVVNAPPTVSLVAPASGALYHAPVTITLNANAADSDGTVAKVEFYAGATLIGTATAAPYSIQWTNVAAGIYGLTARATDDRGATTVSAAVPIVVNAPPTVSITTPVNGALHQAPAAITISANASDADGAVAKVEFYAGAALIGTAAAVPYGVQWSNVPAGIYSLTAVATDDRGTSTVSAPVSVTVNALPQVSIVSPANGQSFSTPAAIAVTANASDPDGSLVRVELYANGTRIATLTAAPYSFTWTGAQAGSYNLTAKAVDNLGGETLSAAVSVTVTAVKALYFIHADHVGTPREIYNDQQQLVWRRPHQEPFGDSPPDENPSGIGTFEFPLGESLYYADKETANRYAVLRDCYDPATGRFCQSDPIGLRAGLNTYAYSRSDPLRFIDPLGLDAWFGGEGGVTGHAVVVGGSISTGFLTSASTRETCPYVQICPRVGLGLQVSAGLKVQVQKGPRCGKDLAGYSPQVSGDVVTPSGGIGVSVGVGDRTLTGAGIGVGPGWGMGFSIAYEFCYVTINPSACKNTPCDCQ